MHIIANMIQGTLWSQLPPLIAQEVQETLQGCRFRRPSRKEAGHIGGQCGNRWSKILMVAHFWIKV